MNQPVRLPVYAFEGFRLDTQRRVLLGLDGQPIPLTPRVFDALLYFVERSGQLLTKERLLEDLWPDVVVEEHNLNKTVSELRRLLGERPGEHKFIVTKPGRGYRFVATVSVEPTVAPDVAPRESRAEVASVADVDAAAVAAPPRAAKAAHRATRLWPVAAGAGALAVALALFGMLGSSPEPQLRVTPWSIKKGQQWFPAWSPDSSATAFTTFGSAPGAPGELVIRDVNGPTGRAIASRPPTAPGTVIRWTTTGKILFFEPNGLWSISPTGGSPEQVAAIDFRQLGVSAWTRMADLTSDGSTLAMVARDGADSLAVWSATPPNGTLQRYEPAPFAGATVYGGPFLRLAPSGRQILLAFYAAGRGFEAWLLPFPADVRNPPRRVFDNVPIAADSVEFSWLPDERHVVLSGILGAVEQGLKRQLYLLDTQSDRFRVLPTAFNEPGVPVVSPDGTAFIVQDARVDFDIVTLDLRNATVTPMLATSTDRAEILPAWAADSDAMVYATDRSGPWEIWLHRAPLSDRPLITQRDFATPTLFVFAPTLSPDATRVIFHRVAESDESRLWLAAVAGGEPEPLTDEQLTERAGSWSPDGDWYVYWASPREGGRNTLKKVRTTGRAVPETLFEDLNLQGPPAPVWSPDGEWILVNHDGLTLIAADGSRTSRKVANLNIPCAFADKEPLLYCIRGDYSPVNANAYELVVLDFDGNELRSSPLPPAFRPATAITPGIRLSPTRDRLGVTYSVASQSQTLWLVDGLDTVELP